MQGIYKTVAIAVFLLAFTVSGATTASAHFNAGSSTNISTTSAGGVALLKQTAQPAAPNNPITSTVSKNWAGYTATSGHYTSVTGTWNVPSAAGSQNLSADATWVGIGGMNTTDLIQAGTQTIVQNGSVQYTAWYETLPNVSVQVPITVNPGDSITATITETSTNDWLITIVDHTNGQTYSNTVNYASSHSSVEWIEEMPSFESGNSISFMSLDNFGVVNFTAASDIDNGNAETLSTANVHALTMASGNMLLASPSVVGSDGESFTVTRGSGNIVSTLTPTASRWYRRGRGDQGSSSSNANVLARIFHDTSRNNWKLILVPPAENGEYYLPAALMQLAQEHPVQVVEQSEWIPIGYPEDLSAAD